jgi:hypothetical protein
MTVQNGCGMMLQCCFAVSTSFAFVANPATNLTDRN